MKRITIRCCEPAVLVVCCGALALAGCGGNGSANQDAQQGFTLTAEVLGLNGSGLSLADPGMGLNVPVPSNATTVVLASSLRAGDLYEVTVGTQPVDENCVVAGDGTGASGTLSGNVDVTITCFPASSGFVLHSFAGGGDGTVPFAALVQASDGNLYGTTQTGGTYDDGTVFRITPGGVETVLYSFAGGNDGVYPMSALVQASDGNFYGTTGAGGASDGGTVFQITPAGVETVLHAFSGGSDGSGPEAGVIQAKDGNLYGTTWGGGANNEGTVFELTRAGAETVLYSFTGVADGQNPTAGLIQASNGNFYGVAPSCCAAPLGSSPSSSQNAAYGTGGLLYTLSPTGTFGVLYSFNRNGSDGSEAATIPSNGGVIQGNNGYFYGTTANGGAQSEGTVFEVDPLQ